jgi:hypothetical protein
MALSTVSAPKTSLRCGERAAIFAAPFDRAIALEQRRS